MATYVLPQVLVHQDFNEVPSTDIRNLNAFICGGHAFLRRCSEADEKADAYIGVYDNLGANVDGEFKTCYAWPNKPAGSIIDTDYTLLCIDNALLRYFLDTSQTMIRTAKNKIRHPTKVFKSNPLDPDTYPRSADFLDRDVAVGDVVKVTAWDDDESEFVTLCTYVRGIEADPVAASIDAAAADEDNAETQINADSDAANADNSGDATIDSVDSSTYNGLADGDITETYTITVVQASSGGDATTATLRVVSASGNDDDLELTPAAFGSPTDIGSRGLTVTWDGGSSEFTLEDEWTVEASQAFTAPTATSAGTYTGTSDRTYIVEVTRGGLYAGATKPQITVSAVDGSDYSGPTNVTAAATNVSAGTKGVLVQFNTTGLRKGDRYTIVANAESDGEYNTLVLGHSLPDGVYTDTTGYATSEDSVSESGDPLIDIALYIKTDLSLGAEHESVSGQYNWEQSDTEFCVFADMQAYHETWTDDGVPVALDIITDDDCANTNLMYVQYRAWRSDIVGVESISDVADIDDQIDGALHPDNVLKWAVFKALSNSNGQPVKYSAIPDPSGTEDWVTALNLIEERSDVYGLVPLTRDQTVLDLFEAHVNAQSTETAGRWRVLWVNLSNEATVVKGDATLTDNSAAILATTEDDSDTSGTQYTILRVTSDNIELDSNGIGLRPGDTVRYQFTTDGWGNSSYTEYEIDAVLSEDTVRLVTGTSAAENSPRKVEFYRTLTATEQSDEIASSAGNWANRRVRAVWPDEITSGSYTFPGYHLCAALAGLASGVVPHQSLTRVELAGFDSVERTTSLFNRTQLDNMGVNGTWIVTQHPQSGEIFTRHAVTTDDYEVVSVREEAITRNVDSISFYFLDVFDPYIGISNVTPSMLDIIEAETKAGIQFLRQSNRTDRLGGQLIDAEISDLRISPVFTDRIVLGLSLDLPYPLNNLELHLLV